MSSSYRELRSVLLLISSEDLVEDGANIAYYTDNAAVVLWGKNQIIIIQFRLTMFQSSRKIWQHQVGCGSSIARD